MYSGSCEISNQIGCAVVVFIKKFMVYLLCFLSKSCHLKQIKTAMVYGIRFLLVLFFKSFPYIGKLCCAVTLELLNYIQVLFKIQTPPAFFKTVVPCPYYF